MSELPPLGPLPRHATRSGRFLLLALMAGLLFLRQAFAHRNLGEIPLLWGGEPWKALGFLYVSEVTLVLLLPIALIEGLRLWRLQRSNTPITAEPLQAHLGWPVYLALAFVAWGVLHALYAFVATQPRDMYLIARQSAMAGYALIFVYGVIFFQRERRFIDTAVSLAVMTALITASVDFLAARAADPAAPESTPRWAAFFNEKPWGQETLPIAILAAGLLAVYSGNWAWRIIPLAVLAFVGWRQGIRFQSVVPIALAGALAGYLVIALLTAMKGHEYTLQRAAFVLILFAIGGALYLQVRPTRKEDVKEVSAWSPGVYLELLNRYETAEPPAGVPVFSTRSGGIVGDPEVIRLNTVYETAKNDSVRNNIWRFLVWRRMAIDWSQKRPVLGAGVGRPWFYDALYHTQFHYGEDRLGLDPHNSFLNLLYRYGLIGFLLLFAIVIAALNTALRALRRAPTGDVLLEGLLLYFFSTVVFSSFTVALEGAPYALPFWFSLALVYARARQILHALEV